MIKQQHNFIGGLDKDTSVNKYDNQHYYHAENIELLTQNGLTTGDIESVKGNEIFINNIDKTETIIGNVVIRDFIVIFTINSSSYNKPDSIYLYNPNNKIKLTRIWNGNLNFSIDYPIKNEKIVGIYENENNIRIYWCDGINPLRFCNIVDTYLEDYSANDFNIVQEIQLHSDVNIVAISKGNIKCCKAVYAYQLYKLHSVESQIINITHPIDLGIGNLTSANSSVYYGGENSEVNSGKSVEIKISGLDDNYDRIRIIGIYYLNEINEPEIKIITESAYSSDSFTFIDYGTDYIGSYTVNEYLTLRNLFTCETIVSKNNYLFVGNTKEEYFDFDYDARAYRFNKYRECLLYSSDGTSITLADDYNIDEMHDCINETNNVENDLQRTLDNIGYSQGDKNKDYYIYGNDGSTAGGTGKNVSYEIKSEELEVSFLYDESTSNTNKEYKKIYSIYDNDLKSYKGYTSYKYKKSFQEDEIYSFGVVGYDKYGRNSFVKWIGDIRFQTSISNAIDHEFKTTYESGNNDQSITLKYNRYYIDFSFSNIPSDVKYIQVVRCERTLNNRTVLDAGILSELIWNQNESGLSNKYGCKYNGTGKYFIPATNETHGYRYQYATPNMYFDDFISADRIDVCHNKQLGISSATIGSGNCEAIWYVHTYYRSDNSDPYYYTSYNINENKFYQSDKIQIISDKDCEMINGNISGTYWMNSGKHNRITSSHMIDTVFHINVPDTYECTLFGARRRFIVPYGGNKYQDRVNRKYIPCSDIKAVNNGSCEISVEDGDVICSYWAYMSTIAQDADDQRPTFLYFPVISTINVDLLSYPRIQDIVNSGNNTTIGYYHEWKGAWFTYAQDEDAYRYNNVYSRDNNVKIFIPKPFDFEDNSKNDCRISNSVKKEYNEDRDSWTVFLFNNFIDIDTKYGCINALVNYNNELLAFQNNAITHLSAEQKELLLTENSSLIVSGSGGVLNRFDYISTNYGCNSVDTNSIICAVTGLYWFDRYNKIIAKLDSNGTTGNVFPLSSLKGINSYLKNISFINKKVFSGYDKINNKILFTFYNITNPSLSSTVSYNELLQSFISFYTFKPYSYLTYNSYLLSVYNSKYWIHNENAKYCNFFDLSHNVNIQFIIRQYSQTQNANCRFDILEWLTDVIEYTQTNQRINHNITFNNVRITNSIDDNYSYQDTEIIDLVLDETEGFEKRFNTWRLNYIRDSKDEELSMFKSTFIKADFNYRISNSQIEASKIIIKGLYSYITPLIF